MSKIKRQYLHFNVMQACGKVAAIVLNEVVSRFKGFNNVGIDASLKCSNVRSILMRVFFNL